MFSKHASSLNIDFSAKNDVFTNFFPSNQCNLSLFLIESIFFDQLRFNIFVTFENDAMFFFNSFRGC